MTWQGDSLHLIPRTGTAWRVQSLDAAPCLVGDAASEGDWLPWADGAGTGARALCSLPSWGWHCHLPSWPGIGAQQMSGLPGHVDSGAGPAALPGTWQSWLAAAWLWVLAGPGLTFLSCSWEALLWAAGRAQLPERPGPSRAPQGGAVQLGQGAPGWSGEGASSGSWHGAGILVASCHPRATPEHRVAIVGFELVAPEAQVLGHCGAWNLVFSSSAA